MPGITLERLPSAAWQNHEKLERLGQLIAAFQRLPQSKTETLLTIEDAVRFSNLSIPTIFGKVHGGFIPFPMPGKQLYFFKDELTLLVKQCCRKVIDELAEVEGSDSKDTPTDLCRPLRLTSASPRPFTGIIYMLVNVDFKAPAKKEVPKTKHPSHMAFNEGGSKWLI